MLELRLRDEFRGARLRGTTIDFNNDAKTGALDMEAKDFLAITYPSIDLIKSIKAVAPGSNKAVVLVGNRGQGKSHLMAALCHMLSDPKAGEGWLAPWAGRIGQPELATLAMRSKLHVIAEPLHEQRFPYPALLRVVLSKGSQGPLVLQADWRGPGFEFRSAGCSRIGSREIWIRRPRADLHILGKARPLPSGWLRTSDSAGGHARLRRESNDGSGMAGSRVRVVRWRLRHRTASGAYGAGRALCRCGW